MPEVVFYALCLAALLITYALMAYAGVNGSVWIFAGPVVVSIVGMGVVRLLLEPGGMEGLYDPSTQSWAFLWGDSIVLPASFVVLALGQRSLNGGWYDSAVWFSAALLFGLCVAYVWHFVVDGPSYIDQGYVELVMSPTKLWHDITVYGSLTGVFVYLWVPLLVHKFKWHGLLGLLGLFLWGLLGLADNTIHELNPADLHPPVSETRLR